MNQITINSAPTVLPLCYFGHPLLLEKSSEILSINSEIKDLASDMIATMRANDGIGLAAPQIGRNIRLIVLEIPQDNSDTAQMLSPGEAMFLPRMPLCLVNPELSNVSDGSADYSEGCLSIPGVNATVTRPKLVTLKSQLLDGESIECRCGGLLARCLQHEVDHLNGVLFVDLLSKESYKSIEGRLRKLRKRTQSSLKPS